MKAFRIEYDKFRSALFDEECCSIIVVIVSIILVVIAFSIIIVVADDVSVVSPEQRKTSFLLPCFIAVHELWLQH